MNGKLNLSFMDIEKNSISKLAYNMYKEELDKLNEIELGLLGIKTLYVYDHKDTIEAKVFFINSTQENINLDKVTFQLLDENNNIVIEENIDISDIGVIPIMSVRPYSIFFKKFDKKFSINDKYVVFIKNNVQAEEDIILSPKYIDTAINSYEVSMVKEYISMLPPYKKGDLKIRFYKTISELDGTYSCIILLINASEQNGSFSDFAVCYRNKLGLLCAYKKIEDELESPARGIAVYLIKIEEKDIITSYKDIENSSGSIQVIQK